MALGLDPDIAAERRAENDHVPPVPRELAVAVMLALLLMVWRIGMVVGEIYPAVVLPSFGYIPAGAVAGETSWQLRVETDSGPETFTISELYADLKSSTWPYLSENVEKNLDDPEVERWLLERAHRLTGQPCVEAAVFERVSEEERAGRSLVMVESCR